MSRGKEDESLQLWACGTLLNLASGADDGAVSRGEAILASGALTAVIRAMLKHQLHGELQQWGCGVLLNLSAGERAECNDAVQ